MLITPKLIACAVALSGVVTMAGLQSSAASVTSPSGRPASVAAFCTTKTNTASKTSIQVSAGKVTAVSGNEITLQVFAGLHRQKKTATSSDSSVGAVTTKTITVPSGCKIVKLGAKGATGTASLSDITVGSRIAVTYGSDGSVSAIAIISSGKQAVSTKYLPTVGKVTAVSGNEITVQQGYGYAGQRYQKKTATGSGSSSSTAVTTKTITVPSGCKIVKLGAKGATGTASLSDITVGSRIAVTYGSDGSVSTVSIQK